MGRNCRYDCIVLTGQIRWSAQLPTLTSTPLPEVSVFDRMRCTVMDLRRLSTETCCGRNSAVSSPQRKKPWNASVNAALSIAESAGCRILELTRHWHRLRKIGVVMGSLVRVPPVERPTPFITRDNKHAGPLG